jgi:hypothetical protein
VTTGIGLCVSGECRISCDSTYPTLCAATNACVVLMSDGKNCGTCGHDCLGGPCVAGQCQPVMIAQYLGHPHHIYVGAQAVYFTNDSGYMGRANKDGSDLKPLALPGFAASAFYATVVVEDGDRVFLSRYGGSSDFRLSHCQTSGCDATATAIGGPYSQYFAVDQANHKVVWVEYSPTRLQTASTVGAVSAVDLPGGALTTASSILRLFYGQGGIYFADQNVINRIPVSGGPIASVTVGTQSLTILGVNSTLLFVYDGQAIASIPLPSGDGRRPTPIISVAFDASTGGHFAADDSSIYWASNNRANSCQISNCSATQKALPKRAIDSIYDVAVDSAAIYLLAESGDANNPAVGTVWKLAR